MSNNNPYGRTSFTLGSPVFPWGASPKRTREEQLEYDLRVALQRLEAASEIPGVFASVLEVGEKYVTIATGPQVLSLRKPMAMEIVVGDIVRLRAGDQGSPPSINYVVTNPPAAGGIVTVQQVVDDCTAECQVGPNRILVYYPPTRKPKAGDRVILDLTEKVIARNLGRTDKSKIFTQETGVTWDDVGGLAEAKADLIEAIEEPIRYKDLYKRYKKRPTRGVLLYGPPGTGKTLLGKAAATALAKVHGKSARSGGFLYVKGPELLNMFVGNSEANIRQLFATARVHKEEHGYPAIVFIDEADALMGKRGNARGFEGMERTLVPQFLAEMDGLEDAGCMVLLATNRPDTLDPAVVRKGRVDKKVYVRRPTQEESTDIFKLYLKDLPVGPGVTVDDLAKEGARTLFDEKHALYKIILKKGEKEEQNIFAMRDLASGALIAGLANEASQLAIRRERDGKKPSGVTFGDLRDVVAAQLREERALDHADAIGMYFDENKVDRKSVVNIERVQ